MYSCNHSPWGNSFYNQYLQHHTQLTQWFQQLHQRIDPNRGAHCCNYTHARPSHRGHTMQHLGAPPPCCNPRARSAVRGPRHCCSAPARPACRVSQICRPPVPMSQQYARACAMPPIPRYVAPSCGGPTRIPASQRGGRSLRHAQAALAYVEKEEEESEDSTEGEDDSGSDSDDEIVCDIDAIIAMREGRDDSDKDSEESFDLVDSVEDEKFKFEYVEMDEYGIMQRRYGKRREVNTLEEELLKKEQREYLYGERADAICGLETLMAINFDHFTDNNQPVLWPVLPLAL